MEMTLVVLLVLAGFAYVIGQGIMVRRAWRGAAEALGLKFENSIWTPSIKMSGEVEGFQVEVKYFTVESREFSQGKSQTKRTSYSRIYVSHPGIPKMTDMNHHGNPEYAVSGGLISYPVSSLKTSFLESLLKLNKKQHFYNADAIVANVRFMIQWGKELASSGDVPA